VPTWTLSCTACDHAQPGDTPAGVCPQCAQPLFARYTPVAPWTVRPRWDLWRYAAVLPAGDAEPPVTLGEGLTPMHEAPALARRLGVGRLWIKDEGRNPTASFKARGMSTAVTRARALGAAGLVVPTAGNAGAAIAAYGAAGGLRVRVYAPRTTPPAILMTVAALGADLHLVDGHIGDAGRMARAFAAETGWADVSTLREPYRVEGMKTMGYELAEQLGRRLPDAIVYPTAAARGRSASGRRSTRCARGAGSRPTRRSPAWWSRRRPGARPSHGPTPPVPTGPSRGSTRRRTPAGCGCRAPSATGCSSASSARPGATRSPSTTP
jgi:threonine synthase